MKDQKSDIPYSVIMNAIQGDEDALSKIVLHFQDYICALSLRPVKDENGNEYMLVDEAMRLQLETRLIMSIISRFKVLPS